MYGDASREFRLICQKSRYCMTHFVSSRKMKKDCAMVWTGKIRASRCRCARFASLAFCRDGPRGLVRCALVGNGRSTRAAGRMSMTSEATVMASCPSSSVSRPAECCEIGIRIQIKVKMSTGLQCIMSRRITRHCIDGGEEGQAPQQEDLRRRRRSRRQAGPRPDAGDSDMLVS